MPKNNSSDFPSKLDRVTRLEIIDENGRSYTNHSISGMNFSFQDNDETLKLFIETDKTVVLHNRMSALEELTKISQEMGLYDDK